MREPKVLLEPDIRPLRTIITGAAGALGEAMVATFAERGDRIATMDRTPSSSQSGAVAQIACADLAEEEPAQRAMDLAASALGGIDNLVHLVGAFDFKPFTDARNADFEQLYRDNMLTATSTIRAAFARMTPGSSIVCVGATAACHAGAGMAAYAAAKSGVSRLVEALAIELAPSRIRVNAVMPAIIDTPRNRADMPNADPAEWTNPQAIAEVILFLSSDAARGINGASIPVTNCGG